MREVGGHRFQRKVAASSVARLGTIQSYSYLLSLLWFVNQVANGVFFGTGLGYRFELEWV